MRCCSTIINISSEINDNLICGLLPYLINKNNILLESIKRAEDGVGYILRLYEAEKSQTNCTVKFNRRLLSVSECNMLEDHRGVTNVC